MQKVEALIADQQASGYGLCLDRIMRTREIASAFGRLSSGFWFALEIFLRSQGSGCIADHAVDIEDLADFIDELMRMMEALIKAVSLMRHAGAREIHLRPIFRF